mmetsp:Transcript_42783/g.84065  ORF Transcript_42783/g.84065 Transcript_42783/m.84065 type:complete len:94 (+) Transcript_42783:600-881(+)
MGIPPQIRNISGGGLSVILGHIAKICGEVLTVEKSRRKVADIKKYTLSELNILSLKVSTTTNALKEMIFFRQSVCLAIHVVLHPVYGCNTAAR